MDLRLWLLIAVRPVVRLGAAMVWTWRESTRVELASLALASGLAVVPALYALLVIPLTDPAAATWFWWLISATFAVTAQLEWLRTHAAVAERAAWLERLAEQPTGAPRVAEFACPQGGTHRFVYGTEGWELVGSARHKLKGKVQT